MDILKWICDHIPPLNLFNFPAWSRPECEHIFLIFESRKEKVCVNCGLVTTIKKVIFPTHTR
jgi:hypothetical protein